MSTHLAAAAPKVGELASSLPRIVAWLALGILFGILLIAIPLGIYLLMRRMKKRRQQQGKETPDGLTPLTLVQLWRRFLTRLPRSARQLVARYPAVVVLGPIGSGKSQVVRSFVDWQGQSSQFLPSLIDNPLTQIYLGNRLVVEEIGAPLLYNDTPVVAQALTQLWRPVCTERAPLALITLKLPALESASPEQRSELGHHVRGKLALLGKLVGSPVEARLVLTHMERVRGFTTFARFCAAHQIPITLPLSGATTSKEVVELAADLTKYLPLALTQLSAPEYRQVVLFLKEIPRIAAALDGFLKPLVEWSIASSPPALERLYLFTAQEGGHGSNPFAGRKVQPVQTLGARIKSLIPASWRGSTVHLALAVVLVFVTAGVCIGSAVRQGRALRRAEQAVESFAQATHRAQATLGDVRESAAVRTASHAAREAIDVINVTEDTWIIHRILYRGVKTVIKDKLLETMRQAYFLPLLPRFGAQRDVERTLHTLAVTYAARDSALGALVLSELHDIANSLAISDAILSDYVHLSDSAWSGGAAVPWNRLLSGPAPDAGRVETWVRFFRELQQAYRAQTVGSDQLRRLQQGAGPLMRVADAVRGKRKLAQMLNAISEESPIVEIEQRIGARVPELAPPDWLRDQQVALSGVLHLVHDTDQSSIRAGQMNLAQILRLLTDLDERKRTEDHVFQFEIEEQSYSFSQRVWSDILIRGRNQLVLGALYKSSDPESYESASDASSSSERRSKRGGKAGPNSRDGKRNGADPADSEVQRGVGSGSGLASVSGSAFGDKSGRSSGSSSGSGSTAVKSKSDTSAPDESESVRGKDPRQGVSKGQKKSKRRGKKRGQSRSTERGSESSTGTGSRSSPSSGGSTVSAIGKGKGGSSPSMSSAEASQYNRASYEQNMKGLVQKLDKALSDDNGLPGPQRQFLVRYVQDEVRRYAEKYCTAVLVQHRGYVFPGGALSSTRAALLDLVTPNGSLTTHLKGIADNANLSGLESRFTQPLSACLGQLRPVVTLMTPGKEGGYPGLKGYGEIIAGILKEIDTGKPAEMKEDGKTPGLPELLSPLGRMALAVLAEQEASPERKAEAYLEAQGLAGPLAPPFLAPVQHLTRLGLAELDSALKQHWEETLQPSVNPLLGRYPFDSRADRELQPSELDLLKPGTGSFWQTFRAIYGPVAVEQDGRWLPRKWPRGTVALPPGMLPLVNQLAQLSTQIFAKDGARKPISVEVRPLPIQACENDTPATVSVLSVAKQRLFGTNSRPAVSAFAIPWWEQEISSVSLEFGKGAGQHAAQSIEVADSQWSFFRLLERATEARGVYTWILPSEGGRTPCEVRFELLTNPLSLFRFNRR